MMLKTFQMKALCLNEGSAFLKSTFILMENTAISNQIFIKVQVTNNPAKIS